MTKTYSVFCNPQIREFMPSQQSTRHHRSQALKACSIPAWGTAPGKRSNKSKRAESSTRSIFQRVLLITLGICAVTIGCSRKIDRRVIQTPTSGLFFTEEIYRGQGAIDNDFTSLYLNLEKDGKVDKRLVLSGTYVELNRIVWTGPSEATLCMQSGGLTDQFRSVATVSVKDTYQSIHFLLKEDC